MPQDTKQMTAQNTRREAYRQLLEQAKSWKGKKDSDYFVINIYKDVIAISPDSREAEEARRGLLEMADKWNRDGRRYSALNLYKELINP